MNKRSLPFIIIIFIALISVASAIIVIQESKVAKATLPYSCDDVKGMQLENLRYKLQEIGFNNISTNEITTDEGRIDIWNGYIKEVTVNGKVDFDSTKKYKLDTPIVISYYNVKTVNGQAESLMHPDTDGYRPISINDFNSSTDSYLNNSKISLSGKFEINKCIWCYDNVLLGSLEDEVFINGEDCGTVQDFIKEHANDKKLVHGYEIKISSDNDKYNVYATFNEQLSFRKWATSNKINENNCTIRIYGTFKKTFLSYTLKDITKVELLDDSNAIISTWYDDDSIDKEYIKLDAKDMFFQSTDELMRYNSQLVEINVKDISNYKLNDTVTIRGRMQVYNYAVIITEE